MLPRIASTKKFTRVQCETCVESHFLKYMYQMPHPVSPRLSKGKFVIHETLRASFKSNSFGIILFCCFSVQFHPEGRAGPMDSEFLFDVFLDVVRTHGFVEPGYVKIRPRSSASSNLRSTYMSQKNRSKFLISLPAICINMWAILFIMLV